VNIKFLYCPINYFGDERLHYWVLKYVVYIVNFIKERGGGGTIFRQAAEFWFSASRSFEKISNLMDSAARDTSDEFKLEGCMRSMQ
jgi:hypothetical protein